MMVDTIRRERFPSSAKPLAGVGCLYGRPLCLVSQTSTKIRLDDVFKPNTTVVEHVVECGVPFSYAPVRLGTFVAHESAYNAGSFIVTSVPEISLSHLTIISMVVLIDWDLCEYKLTTTCTPSDHMALGVKLCPLFTGGRTEPRPGASALSTHLR